MFVVGFRGCSPAEKASVSVTSIEQEQEEAVVETISEEDAGDSDEDTSSDAVEDATDDVSADPDEDAVGVRPEDAAEESERKRRGGPDRRRWMSEGLDEEGRERMREMMGRFRPGMFGPEGPIGPSDPNQEQEPGFGGEPLEAVNLNNVEMRSVLQKIAEWTGKPIIPATDEIMQLKITIYSPEKLERSKAIALVFDALRAKGVIAEKSDDKILLKPVAQARVGFVPTLGADEPLARLEDKSAVVEKFFRLDNYSPARMAEIIGPLTAEYGHVTAIESTDTVVVIDTVENLLRIERIIRQIDVPESAQVEERIFEIENGDPAEIVQVLELILSTGQSSRQSRGGSDRGRNPGQPPQPGQPGKPPPQPKPGQEAKPATSVIISPSEIPIKLIPIPKQNWIIARASADDMETIARWIEELDRKETIKAEQSVVQIAYVDAREVAEIVKSTLRDLPGTELKANVVVEALPQSKQIVIFGNEENRRMVERMIAEIDLPIDDIYEEKTFKLKHADPDKIKENIDGLFGDTSMSSRFSMFDRYRYGRSRSSLSEEEKVVKVISYPTLKQVTVIASARNMEKITRQIEEEWDIPIDIEKDQYRIIPLANSDPVKMVDLLTTLFSEESTSAGRSRDFIMMIFGGRSTAEKEKIVGSLYGMLTFEPVPETKKIIVISKIPEAYDVIEKLVRELDSQEKAEVPKVITLKYADPEELCDQLNAILNEPGTTATLQRSTRGLSDYDPEESTASSSSQESGSAGTITPWWTRQRLSRDEEMPTSNLIGQIRFIPVHRSKAVLVLSPPEYFEDIKGMIEELDQPGMQVMIKVVIVEVDHNRMTSLGVELASPSGEVPLPFETLGDNALSALSLLTNTVERGSFEMVSTLNVNALVDLLVKKVDAKILNQPTLWTKDNKEAIFVKGKEVALLNSAQSDTTGQSITTAYNYRDVGVTLRMRPNITPEKAVDMTINLEISEVATDDVNNNVSINKLDTTTNLIVNDGQTILLGGILFRTDTVVERKVPLLGDIPIAGALFSHEETQQRNNELLAFVTPYVIDANSLNAIPADTRKQERVEEAQDKMEKILNELEEVFMEDTNQLRPEQNKAKEEETLIF
jgi:general secretion pathway protein D